MSQRDELFLGRRVEILEPPSFAGRLGTVESIRPERDVYRYRVAVDAPTAEGLQAHFYFAGRELDPLDVPDTRKVCYYAHCIALYDTPEEDRDVTLIEGLGYRVVNPNTDDFQRRADESKIVCGDAMLPFLEAAEDSDLVAFRALPDGAIPGGVYKEVMAARRAGVPVIELPSSIQRRGLDIDETREYLENVGYR